VGTERKGPGNSTSEGEQPVENAPRRQLQQVEALLQVLEKKADAISPLFSKLTKEQALQVLISHAAERRLAIYLLFTVAVVFLLCLCLLWWLSLHYGQAGLVTELLKLIGALLGGFGLGVGAQRITPTRFISSDGREPFRHYLS
jgi:hypothetical protein